MKNKTTKIVLNSVLLAAMAALGITVYQLGTSPKNDPAQDEISMGSLENEAEAGDTQEPMEAGTSQVEASLGNQTAAGDNSKLLADADSSLGLSGEDAAMKSQTEDLSDTTAGDVLGVSKSMDSNVSEAVSAADLADTSIIAPEINFSEDTLMEWPVNGNILVDYSMDQTTYFPTLDQYKLSPAIAVQAVEDAPVMAAVNGTVYSIEQDVQTGTTVTMELGNGYQAIYGQLKDLNVAEGDTVKEGTIIGYISQPTKYYSREGSNLYFAMKKDGEPIDPIAYLP